MHSNWLVLNYLISLVLFDTMETIPYFCISSFDTYDLFPYWLIYKINAKCTQFKDDQSQHAIIVTC